MTRSEKDEYEGDNEAGSGTPDAEYASDEDEHWIEDHAQKLEIGSAKDEEHEDSSEDAEEESRLLTQEQITTIRDLCNDRYNLLQVTSIMGIPQDTVEYYELKRVFLIANTILSQSMNAQEGSSHGQARSPVEEANFEPYDPVRWETAAEETPVNKSPSEDGAGAPNTPDDVGEEASESSKPAPTVPTSKPVFVRALKDSKGGSWLYYKKGDILRVIKSIWRRNLDSQRFELLPLKPPGHTGVALIQDFEPADQAAVDAVGKAAWTEKEIHSFRCAMEWED